MLKQYFFSQQHEKHPIFKEKSNWIPLPSENHTLISFFTCSEQELGSIKTPCHPNIEGTESTARPQKTQSIVIKSFGKGGGIFYYEYK